MIYPYPIGTKVHVADDNLEKYLGTGTLVGYVGVFYFEHPESNFASKYTNPEKIPGQDEIEHVVMRGGSLHYSMKMPKIKLDSGKIIYGIQGYFDSTDATTEDGFKDWVSEKREIWETRRRHIEKYYVPNGKWKPLD